jgi:hypothetical protein
VVETKTNREPEAAQQPSVPRRRPYRQPTVITRPLFERMALGCANPEQGDPY